MESSNRLGKDYLKKYLKKKKSKSKSSNSKDKRRLKILDDNIDSHRVYDNDCYELESGDDAPVVAAVYDDRPPHLRDSARWKPISEEKHDYDTKDNYRKNHQSLSKKENGTLSPPRKVKLSVHGTSSGRKHINESKKSISPPRRRRDQSSNHDISPLRKRRNHEANVSPPRKNNPRIEDISPPRKRLHQETDISPPRKDRYHERRHNENGSSKKIEIYQSPPRRNRISDSTSPQRRRYGRPTDLSPPRQYKHDRNEPSPPISKKSSSPARRNRRANHDSRNVDDYSPPVRCGEKYREISPKRRIESSLSPRRNQTVDYTNRYIKNSPRCDRDFGQAFHIKWKMKKPVASNDRYSSNDFSPPQRNKYDDRKFDFSKSQATRNSPLRRNVNSRQDQESPSNRFERGRKYEESPPPRYKKEFTSPPRKDGVSPVRRKHTTNRNSSRTDAEKMKSTLRDSSSPRRSKNNHKFSHHSSSPPSGDYRNSSTSSHYRSSANKERRARSRSRSVSSPRHQHESLKDAKREKSKDSSATQRVDKTVSCKSHGNNDKIRKSKRSSQSPTKKSKSKYDESPTPPPKKRRRSHDKKKSKKSSSPTADVKKSKKHKRKEKVKEKSSNKDNRLVMKKKNSEIVAPHSIARYATDGEMNAMLMDRERADDPAFEYMEKKRRKDEEKRGIVRKRRYDGKYSQNRFDIPPGHKWDGVDRSNGFENRFFQKEGERKILEKDAYKWSTEDM